jgi:hypothetical protein
MVRRPRRDRWSSLKSANITCSNCHTEYDEESPTCPDCGADHDGCEPKYDDDDDSKTGSINTRKNAKCLTPGAIYTTKVSDDTVSISVKAPFELDINDGKDLEDQMHHGIEKILAPFWTGRNSIDSTKEASQRKTAKLVRLPSEIAWVA